MAGGEAVRRNRAEGAVVEGTEDVAVADLVIVDRAMAKDVV